MPHKKKKILICLDWYYPAYKAGGIIQSIQNLTRILSKFYDFYVFTSSTDFGEQPLEHIPLDQWTTGKNGEKIFYNSSTRVTFSLINKIIKDVNPNFVYLNSMYSLNYTIIPLRVCAKKKIRTVLAPRGMLQQGALQYKSKKKKAFLSFLKLSGWLLYTRFHATDPQ